MNEHEFTFLFSIDVHILSPSVVKKRLKYTACELLTIESPEVQASFRTH